jgi:hypothetical protein
MSFFDEGPTKEEAARSEQQKQRFAELMARMGEIPLAKLKYKDLDFILGAQMETVMEKTNSPKYDETLDKLERIIQESESD